MDRLHKKGIFTLSRFLNEYNLSLIFDREITDGEPGNNFYEILKFWPILSLAIPIKRILMKKSGVRLHRIYFAYFRIISEFRIILWVRSLITFPKTAHNTISFLKKRYGSP